MQDAGDIKLNLSFKEKFDVGIQACLDLIPFVGSFLLKVYYGVRNERRIKRMEAFLAEAARRIGHLEEYQVKEMKSKLNSLDTFEKDALGFIFEELFEKVEREVIGKKIEYFQKYFIATLNNPVHESNFDERRFFLDILGAMSLLECELLTEMYNYGINQSVNVGNLRKAGVDRYAVVGAINRLKSYGYIITYRDTYIASESARGMEADFGDNIELSPFGRKFCEFCLTEK